MRTIEVRKPEVLKLLMMAGIVLFLAAAQPALSAEDDFSGVELRIGGGGDQEGLTTPIRILLLLTLLTFIPAILISVTSFTRLIIVAHFLRQALGTQTMPPNQVLVGLSLFLTFFIMQPVIERVNQDALQPMLNGEMAEMQALDQACVPLREFMFKYTREKDIALFLKIAKLQKPREMQDLPMRVLIPAFMISELKSAFQIGFAIFLPFLVIDMVTASVLLSMGMMQLPPIMISTPFKILLFVMVDGWNLVIGSLVKSFY